MSRLTYLFRAIKGEFLSNRITTSIPWIDAHYGFRNITGFREYFRKKRLFRSLYEYRDADLVLPEFESIDEKVAKAIKDMTHKLNSAKLPLENKINILGHLNHDTLYYFEDTNYIFITLQNLQEKRLVSFRYNFYTSQLEMADYIIYGKLYEPEWGNKVKAKRTIGSSRSFSVSILGKVQVSELEMALTKYYCRFYMEEAVTS
jgi:hypothetical protein